MRLRVTSDTNGAGGAVQARIDFEDDDEIGDGPTYIDPDGRAVIFPTNRSALVITAGSVAVLDHLARLFETMARWLETRQQDAAHIRAANGAEHPQDRVRGDDDVR